MHSINQSTVPDPQRPPGGYNIDTHHTMIDEVSTQRRLSQVKALTQCTTVSCSVASKRMPYVGRRACAASVQRAQFQWSDVRHMAGSMAAGEPVQSPLVGVSEVSQHHQARNEQETTACGLQVRAECAAVCVRRCVCGGVSVSVCVCVCVCVCVRPSIMDVCIKLGSVCHVSS